MEAPYAFWSSFASDLADHAYDLIAIAWEHDATGGVENAFSPLMAFGLFQAAAVLTYFLRWPWRKSYCHESNKARLQ